LAETHFPRWKEDICPKNEKPEKHWPEVTFARKTFAWSEIFPEKM
jgi:hypothetical protein